MQYIYRHNKLQKEYHNLVGVAAGASSGCTYLTDDSKKAGEPRC